jgi:hypothetical protein
MLSKIPDGHCQWMSEIQYKVRYYLHVAASRQLNTWDCIYSKNTKQLTLTLKKLSSKLEICNFLRRIFLFQQKKAHDRYRMSIECCTVVILPSLATKDERSQINHCLYQCFDRETSMFVMIICWFQFPQPVRVELVERDWLNWLKLSSVLDKHWRFSPE